MYALTHIPDKIIRELKQSPEVMYFDVSKFDDLNYIQECECRLSQDLPAHSTIVDFGKADVFQREFWFEYLNHFGKFRTVDYPTNGDIISLTGDSLTANYIEALIKSKSLNISTLAIRYDYHIHPNDYRQLILKLTELSNVLFRSDIKFGIIGLQNINDLFYYHDDRIKDRMEFIHSDVPVCAGITGKRLDRVQEGEKVDVCLDHWIHHSLKDQCSLIEANIKAFSKLVNQETISVDDFIGGSA